MHTCPSCTSGSSVGNEMLSACASCGDAVVAGMAFPMAPMIAAIALTAAGFIAMKLIRTFRAAPVLRAA